jgi:PilZ domain
VSKAVKSVRAGQVPRSERFLIQTPARYRVKGEWQWCAGAVSNISISGVLLRTEKFIEIDSVIEARFVLPVEMAGEGAAEVICRGVVVRAVACPDVPGDVLVATRIEFSRLLRQTG